MSQDNPKTIIDDETTEDAVFLSVTLADYLTLDGGQVDIDKLIAQSEPMTLPDDLDDEDA